MSTGAVATPEGGAAPVIDAGVNASAPDASRSEPDASVDAGDNQGSVATSPQDAAIAEAAVGPCRGEGCPECLVSSDCELRGKPGATCADSKCWMAAAQCSVDNDCVARGPEYVGGRCLDAQCRPNPRWRCEAPPQAPVTGVKQLTTLVRDSLSLIPLSGVKAVICQKLDLVCASPVGESETQANGYLTMTVPANFAGYLKVEQPNYTPALYFLPPVLPSDGELQPFPLLPSGLIFDALAVTLGTGVDRTRGHMMLVAEDCMGSALPSVRFSSPQRDARTVQFYVRDLLPSTSAMETAEIGNGGYLNFPAGTAVLSLKKVDTGLNLTTVSVVVRPNFITVAYIRPDRR